MKERVPGIAKGAVTDSFFEPLPENEFKPGNHSIVNKKGKWGIKMSIAKEEAKNLLDRLPDHASWGDIMYEFYVKEKITTALKAAKNGKVISHDEVKKRFLPK